MFRNLSLFKHILLALVPGLVIAVPVITAFLSDSYPSPFTELSAAVIYCALFGGFVMAPFITAYSHVVQRTAVLLVAAPVVYFLVSIPVSFAESFSNNWSSGEGLILIVIVCAVFVLNLLNALLLAIVAELETNRKFWGLLASTGAVTGVMCAVLFHYFFCILWCDWTVLLMCIPLFAWPVSFCVSVHFWRSGQWGQRLVDARS